jgi:hypothetical protein
MHAEGLGIEAWGNCNMTLIESNKIDHWISLDNSHFCAVRNNVIEDTERDMALGLEAVAVSRSVFTDNRVLDGQHIGLSVSNTMRKEYAFFGYNTFTNNAVWAAQLQVLYLYSLSCKFRLSIHERLNVFLIGRDRWNSLVLLLQKRVDEHTNH